MTDQPLSESKMATTGQSTTGMKRTTALNSRCSHLVFLAALLLISLLTSAGKAKAQGKTYTVVMTDDASTCHITVDNQPISVDTKTFTLVPADGYKLPTALTSVVLDADGDNITLEVDENLDNSNQFKYNSVSGEVTISSATTIGDGKVITITATGVAKDIATLKTFTYQLDKEVAVTVDGFTKDQWTDGYTVSNKDFTKQVTLAGEVTDKSEAAIETTPVDVTIDGEAGTGTATATLTVTAKDGVTQKTYTVKFTFNTAKITSVTAPEAQTLESKVTTADQAIEQLPKTVDVETENAEVTTLDIAWKYTGDGFNAANGATNDFTWTATVPETLDVNGQTVTGNITVTNSAGSTNAKLSALTYTIGETTVEVSGFNAADEDNPQTYTVALDASIAPDAEITVNATAAEAEAKIAGKATGTLSENTLTITLTVTPESGSSNNRTVNVIFNRTPSDDATLSNLIYKVGENGAETQVPDFGASTTSYDIALPYNTSATADVFVTPTTTSPYATYAGAPQPLALAPLKTTLDGGEGTLTFTVTAENEVATQKVTINFTTAKMKITAIKAPVAPVLEGELANDAILKKLGEEIGTVTVTLEDNSTKEMAITWKLKDDTEFTKAAGAKNTYTWTITETEYKDYELGSLSATGDMEVVNFAAAVTGDQANKDLVISDSEGLPTQIGDADGRQETTINSVTVSSALDQLNVSNTTIKENLTIGAAVSNLTLAGTTITKKVVLNENVSQITMDKAIVAEVELKSTKSATLVVSPSSEITQITNAGTLTLNNTETAPVNLLSVETKVAALANNGTVKAVANEGTFTDNTATIVDVTGKGALTITSLPTDKSTTGDKIEFEVATSTATYQWQKLVSDTWEDIAGNTNAKLTVTKGEDKTGAGSYRCKIERQNSGATTTLYTPAVTATFNSSVNPGPDPVDPTPATYTVKLPKVEGAAFSKGETNSVKKGDDFSFTITLDKDYDQSKPIVKVGDTVYEADADGNYVIKAIDSDITINVTGIVKNTATGNEETTVDSIRVWSEGNTLYIHTASAKKAYIVTGTGMLQRQFNASGDMNMQLPAGFYIVRIGNVSQKVIIR